MAELSISQVTSISIERTRSSACAWTSIKILTASGEVHEVILFSASDQPVSIPTASTANELIRPETEGGVALKERA